MLVPHVLRTRTGAGSRICTTYSPTPHPDRWSRSTGQWRTDGLSAPTPGWVCSKSWTTRLSATHRSSRACAGISWSGQGCLRWLLRPLPTRPPARRTRASGRSCGAGPSAGPGRGVQGAATQL